MQEGREAQSGLFLETPSFVTAAHELKAPLALIRQLAIELETGEYSKLERAVLARRVSLTAERALRLTTDITKARRLDDALFPLEAVDVGSVCNEVVDELQPLFCAHDKKIRLNVNSRQTLTVANRDLLRRIVLNFTDNALQYCDKKSTVAISVNSRENQKTVRIGVRDFGPVVPTLMWRSLRTGLLNPLQMQSRPESSGLGIFIAHEFALAIRASIGVIRHKDGATFYVDVPASTQLRLL